MASNNEQLRAAAAGLQNRISGKLSGIWWAFLLRGLLALVLGVSALIWPGLTLALLIRLIGIYVVLDGAAGVVSSIHNRELEAYLVLALASLAVGADIDLLAGTHDEMAADHPWLLGCTAGSKPVDCRARCRI